MKEQERQYVSQWIEKAQADMVVAKMIIDQNPSPLILDSACFHCQQAVEKFLKAFLVSRQVPFESRTTWNT